MRLVPSFDLAHLWLLRAVDKPSLMIVDDVHATNFPAVTLAYEGPDRFSSVVTVRLPRSADR